MGTHKQIHTRASSMRWRNAKISSSDGERQEHEEKIREKRQLEVGRNDEIKGLEGGRGRAEIHRKRRRNECKRGFSVSAEA